MIAIGSVNVVIGNVSVAYDIHNDMEIDIAYDIHTDKQTDIAYEIHTVKQAGIAYEIDTDMEADNAYPSTLSSSTSSWVRFLWKVRPKQRLNSLKCAKNTKTWRLYDSSS